MSHSILETELDRLVDELLSLFPNVLSIHSRLYWGYLVIFILICFIRFRFYGCRPRHPWSGGSSATRFLRYCFPPEILTHRSALLDYQVYFTNQIVSPLFSVAKWWSAALIGSTLSLQLAVAFGDHGHMAWSGPTSLLFSLLLLLVSDLATYINHRLHHELALLWPFHSVHHSAEVLTPFTLYRKHPLYDLTKKLCAALIIGVFQGVVAYLFVGPIETVKLFGINMFFFLLFLPLSNLRHSHIWISYGSFLNHVLISPAQHQIHHSCLPRHINKNYGEVFAIWDWLFGTLYVPKDQEELVLGLGPGADQPHSSVARFYLQPFVDFWVALTRRDAAP